MACSCASSRALPAVCSGHLPPRLFFFFLLPAWGFVFAPPHSAHPKGPSRPGHRRLFIPAMLTRLSTGFVAPCLPTKAHTLPAGSQWLHEIKHDGFRIIARKDGGRVRLYSRPGNDFTRRFPLIVEALARLRPRSMHHRRRSCRLRRQGCGFFRSPPQQPPQPPCLSLRLRSSTPSISLS